MASPSSPGRAGSADEIRAAVLQTRIQFDDDQVPAEQVAVVVPELQQGILAIADGEATPFQFALELVPVEDGFAALPPDVVVQPEKFDFGRVTQDRALVLQRPQEQVG